VAQGDGWRDEKEIEARGAGDALVVSLAAPATPALAPTTTPTPTPPPSPPAAADSPQAPPADRTPALPASAQPDGFVWGASFAIVPCYLLGVTTAGASNERPAASIVAGPSLALGIALTERFELLLSALGGLGPDAKPSYLYMGGPGLSFKVVDRAWLGMSFLGGQLETRAHAARYGTDIVFGGMLEASVVLLAKHEGEWIASFQPSFLLTEMHADNTTLFFPLSFGYRSF
jgi:hypothetical protein